MQRCVSLVLAGALMVTPLTAEAAPSMSELHVLAAGYEQAIHRKELAAHKPRSSLPTADEARLMSLDRDMFTDDAWAGMVKWVASHRAYCCCFDRCRNAVCT